MIFEPLNWVAPSIEWLNKDWFQGLNPAAFQSFEVRDKKKPVENFKKK